MLVGFDDVLLLCVCCCLCLFVGYCYMTTLCVAFVLVRCRGCCLLFDVDVRCCFCSCCLLLCVVAVLGSFLIVCSVFVVFVVSSWL